MDKDVKPSGIWTDAETETGFIVNVNTRADSLEKAWDEIKSFIAAHKLKPAKRYGGGSKPFQNAPVATKMCTEHNIEMKEKTSRNTGKKYFSHWEGKYPDLGMQCFGDGYKPKPGEVPERQVEDDISNLDF